MSSFFRSKVFCEDFMYVQFGFVIFWQKEIDAKAAQTMLGKWSPPVADLTNVCKPSLVSTNSSVLNFYFTNLLMTNFGVTQRLIINEVTQFMTIFDPLPPIVRLFYY